MDGCWHRKLQIAEYSDEDIFYSVWINFTRLLLLFKMRKKNGEELKHRLYDLLLLFTLYSIQS